RELLKYRSGTGVAVIPLIRLAEYVRAKVTAVRLSHPSLQPRRRIIATVPNKALEEPQPRLHYFLFQLRLCRFAALYAINGALDEAQRVAQVFLQVLPMQFRTVPLALDFFQGFAFVLGRGQGLIPSGFGFCLSLFRGEALPGFALPGKVGFAPFPGDG